MHQLSYISKSGCFNFAPYIAFVYFLLRFQLVNIQKNYKETHLKMHSFFCIRGDLQASFLRFMIGKPFNKSCINRNRKNGF